ncbi:hypothetical protein EGH25_10560 [Haladaptatus sp. F3-133]|uniref:SpoVT-AbrB domain-containing protein n=1 Tax=Halorutilus salinus TaxID=2487751 RepID=A0A9Q4C602_9EURY|nr:hypothetical protein [Halorutilus salinus]MCX2819790.1 hypothetical protein [Halorutilus salinus]
MVGKSTGKLGRVGNTKTMRLTIPAGLASDTSFPFEEGDEVEIEIVDDELRIRKQDSE